MRLCSASRAYLVLGESKYLQAVQNAWEMITKTQSYASGGWAPNEEFVVPNKGLMGESLTKTHAHFETPCGSYAHLKLTRYLLRFTGEGRYGDSLERVLYNTILGIKDPKGDGHVFYYSDYHPDDAENLPSRQVALLLGDNSASGGGLCHQHLFPGCGRNLREPLHALRGELEGPGNPGEAHPDNNLPGIGFHRIAGGSCGSE